MSGLDLYQTQSAMLWMLVWAIVTGICLGGFYDMLRALRILIGLDRKQGSTKLSRVVIFGGDVLLTVTAFIALTLLCYYTNDGSLRGPAVWGMAGGFFVYVQTVGRLTARVEVFLARLLENLLRAVWNLVRRPLVWMGLRLFKMLRNAWYALFGMTISRHRARKQARQQDRQNKQPRITPADTIPQRGTTVFSTRRQV